MNYLKVLFICLGFCVFVPQGQAQAQNLKIAVVDVEKILSVSSAGKSIQSQLKTKRESFQKEFSAREDNLMISQKALIKQKTELSAEEFTSKRKSFEQQLLETRNLFQKRRKSLDKGLGNALAQLRKHIINVAAEVSNQEGYQMVLTRDSVVIVEKEIDITDTVLTRLNAKVSNISINTN